VIAKSPDNIKRHKETKMDSTPLKGEHISAQGCEATLDTKLTIQFFPARDK
jgi:hypothetical protein